MVLREASFVHVVPLYTVQCNRYAPQIAVGTPWDAEERTLWQFLRFEELASDLSRPFIGHCFCRRRKINSFLAAYNLAERIVTKLFSICGIW